MTNTNLKLLRKKNKFSLDFVAEKLGMTRQNYWFVEKGERKLTYENQLKLCDLFGCSSINDLYDENIDLNNLNNIDNKPKTVALRYYNLSASAGNGCFVDNENYEVLDMGINYLNEIGISKNYKNIVVIKAVGDSMYPTIQNNDFLFVDITKKEIFNKKIYVINERGFLKVKRLLMSSPLSNTITVKSDNEIDGEYPPYNIKIDGCENVICGMVVFYCRSLC